MYCELFALLVKHESGEGARIGIGGLEDFRVRFRPVRRGSDKSAVRCFPVDHQ